MAWPELTPGAGVPLIDAAVYMLWRTSTNGPVESLMRAKVASGTIFPWLLRTQNCLMASGVVRKRGSAWTCTSHVRPNRLI